MQENRFRYNNNTGNYNRFPKDPLPPEKKKFTFEKVLIIGFLLFVVGSLGYNYIKSHEKEIDEKIESVLVEEKEEPSSVLNINTDEENEDISSPEEYLSGNEIEEVAPSESGESHSSTIESKTPSSQKTSKDTSSPITSQSTSSTNPQTSSPKSTRPKSHDESDPSKDEDYSGLSSIEILERKNHERVVEQARRAGVSTEGSTTEILERINHKRVVEQGRRAGVSTEGSTTDILERINHKRVVEQARRAGVSTEGSTTDILERINHKRVVEQARRAGVSTEGSTTDILERINQKRLRELGY